MPLTQEQIDALLAVAKEAALAAGTVIASYDGRSAAAELKEGGTSIASRIVTQVDALAEQAILNLLEPTLDDYGLGLLTEESADDKSRFKRDYFWCVDPLDGTLPYTQNRSGYSTSIALVSFDGTAILGVVYDPVNKNLYWARKGRGAFKNDKPLLISVSNTDVAFIDGPGGAVMQALETIERAPCIFIKKPKQEEGGGCLWDYAATTVIQSEAGGYNGTYNGQPIHLNASDSVFMNQHGICFHAGLSADQRASFLP